MYSTYFKLGLIYAAIGMLILLANKCFGQTVTFTLKDSTTLNTKIQAVSNNNFHTPNGNITKESVAKAKFAIKRDIDTAMYRDMTNRGITVTFGQIPTVISKQPIKSPIQTTVTTVDLSMERFRMQRTTAKATQLIGALVFGGAMVAQSVYNNKYKEDYKDWLTNQTGKAPELKYVPTAVYIGGVGIMCVGFGIDLDAGKHLKR